ncbi:MAG: hypothetical protein MK132_19190 [Lentisphaerales bacterium]|nr:hypothetical protein [Lentisphaerales bacterium]
MSISKSHKITRLELYNEVWSTSILQISQKYGISDRGLAKLCKRHKIPTPPRGYWAKIESGVKAHKTKLLKPSDNPEIIIRATIKGIKKIQEESVEDLKTEYSYDNDESVEFLLKSLEQESEYEEIVISDNLRGCHKFITRYNELYKKEKEEAKHDRWSNYFHPPTGYGLRNITSFSRAKLILNTIFKEAEKRGYTVA